MNSPATDWWDYEPVTVRCPACGVEMPAGVAQHHASDHLASDGWVE